MSFSVYDLIEFYNSRLGRASQRALQEHIRSFWPDTRNMRLMGVGYAAPYLTPYLGEAERLFSVMTPSLGAYPWPSDGKNLVCLAAENELPVETNSIDRIILIHALEHAQQSGPMFEEIWRVLKSNGRLLIIVPNRLGLWSRVDRTPFGQGRPYSATQILKQLREYKFLHERTRQGLFMFPVGTRIFLKAAAFLENYGRFIFPALAGVHMVEASKQLYAGTALPVTEMRKTRERLIPALMPNPKTKA